MMAVRPALRKALAVAILVAAALALWLLAVAPLQALFGTYNQSISDSLTLLARHGRIVGSRAALRTDMEKMRRSRIITEGFFRERSAELATASIQKILKDTVGKSGAKLTSVQVLPVETETGVQRIGVRVRMSGDIEGLRGTLYALETAWPLLFVDKLSVGGRAIRRRARRQPAREVQDLRIQFDAYGYFRSSGGPTAPKAKPGPTAPKAKR